jgi:two-component system NtrC family sensor kinase
MPTRVHNAKTGRALPGSEELAVSTPSEFLHSILDAVPEAISIHATSSNIVWANQMLCDIYGRKLSELEGLACHQIFHGPDVACPHEGVLEAGSAVQIDGEVRVSGRTFSVTLEPLLDEKNNTLGFTRVMRDVSNERQTQEQLLRAERFATLGQLLSAVAHNVGTPLNVISGYAEFLLMRKNPEDQGYKELTAILDQTRRIAAMFGQALDMARPAVGRNDAIDIRTLLTDAIDLVGHHLRTAGVTARLTCITDKPLIYGEASQLRQAFFNLLLNAGRGLGAGGSLQVSIDDTADRPGFVGLAFLGNEAGGAEHDFSTSLPLFFAKQSESGSTGIGLQLARKILADAGAIVCGAEGGQQGSGFMVYLPVNADKRT